MLLLKTISVQKKKILVQEKQKQTKPDVMELISPKR